MKVQLITCSSSPQCLSTKMFLDLNGIDYTETPISHEEMGLMEFANEEMPILMINDEIEMSGFDALKLKELFK